MHFPLSADWGHLTLGPFSITRSHTLTWPDGIRVGRWEIDICFGRRRLLHLSGRLR